MPRPIVVRLHNWIGDVVVGIPALRLLAEHGCEPTLIGRPWAASLLAGHGWRVVPLARGLRARSAQWRRLRPRVAAGAGDGIDAVLLATSFSAALECRLGGAHAIGHDTDHRRLLLARSVPRPRGVHALEENWHLACRFLGVDAPPPASIGLAVAPDALAIADARLVAAGVGAGFVVLCPFAVGRFEGQSKAWPGFDALADRLAAAGRQTVVCPGPGDEERDARARFPASAVLTGVPLGEYAALLSLAAAVVANDTGPGHMAAAVGAPLVSVLGPTDAARWAPWGPTVQVVQRTDGAWPDEDEVAALVHASRPVSD